MGCCEQNFNNVQIITEVGPAGPTGATGSTGATGAAGSSITVLHNDTTQGDITTTNTNAVFSNAKSYTLPSGTLSDGDSLEIVGTYLANKDTVGEAIALVLIDATDIISNTPSGLISGGPGDDEQIQYNIELTRMAANKFLLTYQSLITSNRNASGTKIFRLTKEIFVNDMDNNNLVFELRGTLDESTGDWTFSALHFLVKHFKIS